MEKGIISKTIQIAPIQVLLFCWIMTFSSFVWAQETQPVEPMVEPVEPIVIDDTPSDAGDANIPTVNSRSLKINYAVSDELKEKHAPGKLWYRLNDGAWQRNGTIYAGDPIEFSAADEGVYEFAVDFSVVSNPSSSQPDSSAARIKCFVDYTAPLLQIIDVRHGGGKILIRWKAYDLHFPERPIEIYLAGPSGQRLLGKFANSGAAVVSVNSQELPAEIKIIATDRAGNSVIELSKTVMPEGGETAQKCPTPVTTAPVAAVKVTTRPVVQEQPIVIPSPNRNTREGDRKGAMHEYKLASEYRFRGQQDLAILHFKRAIDLDAEFVDPYIEIGSVLMTMQRYNDAAEFYLEALGLNQQSVRAWEGLAKVKLRTYQYQQAKYCLEKVVELDDKNIEGWLGLGDAYWTLGQKDDAAHAWEKARALSEKDNLKNMIPVIDSRLNLVRDLTDKK
jgi:tetratricopeptide (TPR) repeat protein